MGRFDSRRAGTLAVLPGLRPRTILRFRRALKAPLRVDLALVAEPDAGAILRAAGLP